MPSWYEWYGDLRGSVERRNPDERRGRLWGRKNVVNSPGRAKMALTGACAIAAGFITVASPARSSGSAGPGLTVHGGGVRLAGPAVRLGTHGERSLPESAGDGDSSRDRRPFAGTAPVAEPPPGIVLSEVRLSDGGWLVLRPPLSVDLEPDPEEPGTFIFDDPELAVTIGGESVEVIRQEAVEQVDFLWRTYALAQPEELTPAALRVRTAWLARAAVKN